MEDFYTIQGEGFHQGKAAYFIRLGGCDVGCVWCDVKESWEAEQHPLTDIEIITSKVTNVKAPLAVITGGEPFMYDLTALTQSLREQQIKCHVETAGVYELTGDWDWITFSPKKFKAPLDIYYDRANELKVIVYNKSDLDWALEHQQKINKDCKLYLQPEWTKAQTMTPIIIEFVKSNPQWEISLQTHKFMDIP